MNKIRIAYILLFLFSIFFSNITIGQTVNNNEQIEKYIYLKDKIKDMIIHEMRNNNLVGVSAALIIGDSVVWKEGFGYADKENKIPMTTETNLCIASLTKPFTGLAMMHLYEQGLLDIDKPLVNYLPEFNMKAHIGSIKEITPRQVLTHHSGIPSEILMNALNEDEDYTNTLNYLNETYVAYPPNLIFCYSNVGFSILGSTIKEVSKTDYPDYVKNFILGPIGMNNSGFMGYHNIRNVSKTYNQKGEYQVQGYYRELPAGGLYSNISDLSKFAKKLIAVYNGKQNGFIKPGTLKETFRVQNENILLSDNKVGLPWLIFENDSAKLIWHGGSTGLSNAGMAIAPELGVAIVFQINTIGGFGTIANNGVILFERELGIEPHDGHASKLRKTNNLDSEIVLKQKDLITHVGDYQSLDDIFQIKLEDGNFVVHRNEREWLLKPMTKTEFVPYEIIKDTLVKLANERYIFTDIMDYHVLVRDRPINNQEILGNKIQIKEISETWKKRIGIYDIITGETGGNESFSSVELFIRDNKLIMFKILSNPSYTSPTIIQNDNELIKGGIGSWGGTTIHFIQKNNTEYLVFSGLWMKKKD